MPKMNNYLPISRDILHWQFYRDPLASRVFLHLLLSAAWNEYHSFGITLQPGQLFTTRERIAEALDLTMDEVQIAFSCLEYGGEITTEQKDWYLLITIPKYGGNLFEEHSEKPRTNGCSYEAGSHAQNQRLGAYNIKNNKINNIINNKNNNKTRIKERIRTDETEAVENSGNDLPFFSRSELYPDFTPSELERRKEEQRLSLFAQQMMTGTNA